MADTSDIVVSTKKSKFKGLAVLLKDVYHFHVEAITALETKVEELEKKCLKLDKVKADLLHKGHDLQKRHDSLVSDHQRVKDELVTANNRLQAPCEVCAVLRGQLEQQEKLYNMVVGAMKNNKSGMQSASQNRSPQDKTENDKENPNQLSPSLLTDISNTASRRADNNENQSQAVLHSNKNQSKPGSVERPESADEISPGTGKSRSLKLTRNSKRSRCKYTEELVPESKKKKGSSEEISPPQTVGQILPLLPLDRTSRDTMDTVDVDILVPQTCNQDSVSMETSEGASKHGINRKLKPSERPNIVIPETVPFDLTDSSDEEDVTTSQKTVIPGVFGPPSHASTPLPSTEKSIHQKHPITDTNVEKSDTEPSKLSEKEADPGDHRTAGLSPPRRRQDSTISEPSSPVFGQTKERSRMRDAANVVRSPSLFDEDDSVHVTLNRSRVGHKSVSETGKNDLSEGSPSVISGKIRGVVSKGHSPSGRRSVMSSHSRVVASPAKLNSPVRGSSRKLVQTTLKMSGTGQSKVNKSSRSPRSLTFDPDETVDPGHAISLVDDKLSKKMQRHNSDKVNEEERMMELAQRESLKQYCVEAASRGGPVKDLTLTFTEPQFTSTPRVPHGYEAGDFKKPLPPKQYDEKTSSKYQFDHTQDQMLKSERLSSLESEDGGAPPDGDMNGTVDPNIHLSQYNTPQVYCDQAPHVHTQTFLEPIGIESIEEGKYQMPASSLQGSEPCRASQRKLRSGSQKKTNSHEASDKVTVKSKSAAAKRSTQTKNDRTECYSEDLPEPSAASVVFGRKSKEAMDTVQSAVKSPPVEDVIGIDLTPEDHHGNQPDDYYDWDEEDSFDRRPKNDDRPGYAYVEVVRDRGARQKLEAHACRECELYYGGLGLSEDEKQERMKSCRHRARFARPDTPEHYWSIDFPDTQEIQDRGYLNTTQARPSKFRRKRGLRPLFLEKKEPEDSQEEN